MPKISVSQTVSPRRRRHMKMG